VQEISSQGDVGGGEDVVGTDLPATKEANVCGGRELGGGGGATDDGESFKEEGGERDSRI
jgi:hypothetical protein